MLPLLIKWPYVTPRCLLWMTSQIPIFSLHLLGYNPHANHFSADNETYLMSVKFWMGYSNISLVEHFHVL